MEPALVVLALALLVVMAVEDYRTRYVTRGYGIFFTLSAFLSLALSDPAKALYYLIGGGIIGALLWAYGQRSRFDVLIIAGAAVLTQSLVVPLIASLTKPVGVLYLIKTGKKRVSIPTITVLAAIVFIWLGLEVIL